MIEHPDAQHRGYAPPRRPWSIFMRWHDLLFMHWPLEVGVLRGHVPPGLEIETFGGSAWLGVIPFTMSGVRHRLGPPVPRCSAFPELNVRTYVRAERDGRPGVWFFSLDAANRLAVRGARAVFGLAYMDARMASAGREGWIEYRSERVGPRDALAHGPTLSRAARFAGRYRGAGGGGAAAEGSLASFLTARFCLYAQRRGRLVRGEIDHEPWRLESAEAEVELNTMAGAIGVDCAKLGNPVLHYAERMDVVAWLPERV